MRLLLPLVCLVVLLPGPATSAAPDPWSRAVAVGVLHDWDARREAAWAASSARALRDLYVPGSAAGRADVRLLRRYAERGLVVRELRTQVFGVRVELARRDRLRLRVLDRVAGGEVVDGDEVLPLAVTRPALRVVDLRRSAGAWRVASVRAVSGWG